jgi:hypothetical protein
MRFFFLFQAIVLLTIQQMNAQTSPATSPCGTFGVSPWLKEYQAKNQQIARKLNDTAWLYVPVTIHITGTNSGTGYFDASSAFRAMCNMNNQFEAARIRYYLVPGEGFNYLNNSAWHDHDWEGGADLIETNRIPDRFNIFVVQNPAGACGYSWLDAVVNGKGCSGANNSTWAHEAGHHFSLPHTFSGWEGESHNYNQPAPESVGRPVERVARTNCYEAGDGFCDTPADYLNFRWSCDDNGMSNQQQKDPDGVPFRSDGSFYMSYSLDACTSRFSDEQIAAMRENLRTEHASYLTQENEPILQIPDERRVELVSPIDSQIVAYNNVTLHWKPLPNASYYHVEVFFYPNMNTRLFGKMVYQDTTVTLPRIINNRAVYWRVRAYSEGDFCQSVEGEQKGVFQTRNLVATNELEQTVTADIMPNPAAGQAQLVLQSDVKTDALLRIVNTTGQTIVEKNVRIFEGENTVELPLNACTAGLYFVSLQNEKGTLTKRLIINE